MTDGLEQEFLKDIIAHPDDDAPRIIYAEWLLSDHATELRKSGKESEAKDSEEKGEFIRTQIALASGNDFDGKPLTPVRLAALQRCERELLHQHEATWSKPLSELGVRRISFRRGFPEAVSMPFDDYVRHHDRLFTLAPIRSARLTVSYDPDAHSALETSRTCVVQLSKRKRPPSLRELTFHRCFIVDSTAPVLFASTYLSGLTSLNLNMNCIGTEGARALAASPHISGLTALNLDSCSIRDEGATALAESPHLSGLRHLNLRFNNLGSESIQFLAASPYLRHLESLDLENSAIGSDDAWALEASFPRIARLKLKNTNVEPAVQAEINEALSVRKQRRVSLPSGGQSRSR